MGPLFIVIVVCGCMGPRLFPFAQLLDLASRKPFGHWLLGCFASRNQLHVKLLRQGKFGFEVKIGHTAQLGDARQPMFVNNTFQAAADGKPESGRLPNRETANVL